MHESQRGFRLEKHGLIDEGAGTGGEAVKRLTIKKRDMRCVLIWL